MKLIPSVDAYQAAFELERARLYSVVDAFEARLGYCLGTGRLESAARVLACPVKAHPPNWQHGRVLYALARKVFAELNEGPVTALDIGTAKGFSALCLEWARIDAGRCGQVTSVDVIDPASQVRRNTVADCDGLKSLREIMAPWPEADAIEFLHDTGIDWLTRTSGRVHFAYVDGKHTHDVVKREGLLLSDRQQPGDVVMFDDCQIDGVAQAVRDLEAVYDVQMLVVLPERRYAIGTRR